MASSACPIDTEPNVLEQAKCDPMDVATLIPPTLPHPAITIEFCDRCRWLHRAAWVQTELLLTFPPPVVKAITIIPLNTDDTAGRFRVWLSTTLGATVLVWDRKAEGGFPELKVLKQRIRDYVQPGVSLGHSDRKEEKQDKEKSLKSGKPMKGNANVQVPMQTNPAVKRDGLEWEQFLRVMRELGFDYNPSTAGSSVCFFLSDSRDRPITFHKPHPDPTLTRAHLMDFGKRLKEHYGWPIDLLQDKFDATS